MSDNIRVGIRMRPKISNDADSKQNFQVKDGRCIYQVSSPSNRFCFDRVFNTDEDNLVVYNDLCLPIVDSVMQGFNGTIFAYGQTSSGKTYTMMGEHNGIIQGIIHFTITDIFNTIQDTPEREFLLRVIFLEIYNEKVYDLLSDKDEDLSLLTNKYGNIYFQYSSTKTSLEEKIVNTPNQILTLMNRGLKKRRTGDTEMNQRSSRSHCLFRMIIESRLRGEEDAVVNVSQLNLVDLAGSENVKQTKAVKDRFKESVHINLSLSSLSQVINQLSEKDYKHINYRNSKLTRILQNSLGGNSLTAILCTVTPTSKENISTLQFALRAKKVKTKPEKNEIFTEQALLKKYEHKIKELSAELEASKEQGKALEEKTKQNENLKKEIEALKSKIVPISQNFQKSIRRETWGGHLDARRLQKTFVLPRNPLPSLTNLSTLEEEPEGDFDITNLDFDLTLKRKKSSTASTITVTSCGSPKHFSDVETQTIDTDFSMTKNFGEAYEDVMEMVATLKTEILRLESELSELTEYTTLEQQAIKAESELHKELEALRNENNILKKALESSSSTLLSEEPISSSPGVFKTSEYDLKMDKTVSILRDETDESNNEKLFHKELDSSHCRNRLNATSLDCEKSIFDVTCKLVSNNSRDEFADSADESMKSHFLALYDECLESETVSKLKTDIESLKYDNSLKDQQINLLKDKIEIKDQMIMSLKDEIMLVKTDGIESVTSNNPESNVYTNDSYKSDSNSQMKEYVDNQTSPLKFMQHVHMDKICQTSFNSLLMSRKDCQTSPLKSEKICFIHRTCQTDFGTLPMMDSRECQTSPLKSVENLHKICQTEFISPVKSIKNSQTSPIKLEETSCICKICQTASNSPIKSIKECQTSPLKLETKFHIHQICQTDFNSPAKSIKECQTSPLKLETKDHLHEVCQTDFDSPLKSAKDCDTTPLKSSHANIKCCRCNGITASDTVDVSPLKSSNSDSKAEVEQKMTTLNEHIMTLEFDVKGKEEYAELLSSQLDLKNEEVMSLNSKLSDAELNLNKIEIEFSKLTEGISNLKQSLSQLTFMCEMLNDVESENEFAKLKKLSEISSSSQYSIPLYDVSLIQNMILKLNSCMEVNASKIITLSAKLKSVENEPFAIQKQNNAKLHCTSLENSSKHSQTEFLNGIDSAKMNENDGNGKLALQFKNEIKCLEEKNKELEKSYEELKQKMKDLEESHSAEIFALEMQCQSSKSDWNIKTMQLINDLEVKYEQELNDQETKFTTDLHIKLLDVKEEHLKQIFKKEVEFKEHIAKVKSLHSEELLQLQKQIKDIEDQLFTESVEKENLRHRLEKEKEHEIVIIRKKFEEVVEKCKDRMRQYKDENSQLKYRQKCYADEIDKLKKENILDKDEPVTQQLIEKLNEISNEKDLLLKKYTIAKQHICEMKEELKKKHKHLSDQEELLQKLSCSTTKETEETNKKLLYDLDQKKAKIMSLETNNANMIVELKKMKDMLSSKNILTCKTNTKGPKTDIPAKSENYYEKKSEQNREHGGVKENQVVRKAALEDEDNQKENETPNGKNADQENILCIGGGSGPANMVKSYWLEGVIHKKDKEIAKLRKELADHKCETKTSHLISSEKKKKNAETGNKAPEVPISVSPLQEMDEHVTVHAVGALHPYPEGAIPKVQAKQILKERNRRSCGKPYDQHPRLLHSKKQDVNSERQQVLSKPKENNPISVPKTKEDVVKVLAEGEPECKQM